MCSWKKYYDVVGDNPNPFAKEVVRRHRGRKNLALDLGAGNLRDSKFFFANGFRKVVAVEKDKQALLFFDTRIPLHIKPIEEFEIARGAYDLIYSCNVLYFLEKELIEKLFHRAWEGLRPGGILACTALAQQDAWCQPSEINPCAFLTALDIGRLRIGFKALMLREHEYDGRSVSGQMKHWHYWSLIFQKRIV